MAIWRRGSELFAEVVAPGEAGVAVDRMGMHPGGVGLVAIWRRGSELFAEVVAPGEAGVAVDRMGMHPGQAA